jgi:hypothetical protein
MGGDRGGGDYGIERGVWGRHIVELRFRGVGRQRLHRRRLLDLSSRHHPLDRTARIIEKLSAGHLALQRPGGLLVLGASVGLGQFRCGRVMRAQPLITRSFAHVHRNRADGGRQDFVFGEPFLLGVDRDHDGRLTGELMLGDLEARPHR